MGVLLWRSYTPVQWGFSAGPVLLAEKPACCCRQSEPSGADCRGPLEGQTAGSDCQRQTGSTSSIITTHNDWLCVWVCGCVGVCMRACVMLVTWGSDTSAPAGSADCPAETSDSSDTRSGSPETQRDKPLEAAPTDDYETNLQTNRQTDTQRF